MNLPPITPETATGLAAAAIRLALVVLGAVIVIRVVGALIGRIEEAIREDAGGTATGREKRARTLGDVLRRTIRGVVVGFAILAAARILGVDVTPVLAAAGGFGVAMGLGAQSLVRDWISGFFIIRDNQFAVGDAVRVAGVAGTVEGLSLRHSEVRDADGALHFVPNGEIKVVTNLTKAWSSPMVRVPVSLTEDPVRAIEALSAMAADLAEAPALKPWLIEPPRVLGVEEMSAGQFTVLLQAKTDPDHRHLVSRAMRLGAIQRLRAAGISLHALPAAPEAPAAAGAAEAGAAPMAAGSAAREVSP
jgi:small conductance mechanosensitive channel